MASLYFILVFFRFRSFLLQTLVNAKPPHMFISFKNVKGFTDVECVLKSLYIINTTFISSSKYPACPAACSDVFVFVDD